MCHHGEASLFGARHKGLGSTKVQCGLEYQLNSETKRPVGSLWSVPDPLGSSEWSVLTWLGGLKLLQTQLPTLGWHQSQVAAQVTQE